MDMIIIYGGCLVPQQLKIFTVKILMTLEYFITILVL
jgi:hypothetical protein